jgi:hypothetical protein
MDQPRIYDPRLVKLEAFELREKLSRIRGNRMVRASTSWGRDPNSTTPHAPRSGDAHYRRFRAIASFTSSSQ